MTKKKLIEILPYEGPPMPYNQLSAKMTWAILNRDYRRMHPPVMCKDYLTDAFWSEHVNKNVQIYGFSWKPGQLSMDQNSYLFEVKFDEKDLPNIKNISLLLGLWEEHMKVPLSKMYPTTNENTFVLEVNRFWVQQPVRVSLLTQLVRIGTAYEEGESLNHFLDRVAEGGTPITTQKDESYVRTSNALTKKIFETKTWPNKEYKDYENYSLAHNCSGIVALSNQKVIVGES